MAPSAKYPSFLFLLLLMSSLQIQARESHFFSKVTPYSNNNSNAKETQTPEKEPSRTKDEEPNFTPQNDDSYGLYGHGSGQKPPSTVNDAYYTSGNYLPEKTTTEEYTGENSEYKFNRGYNNNKYETKQKGMSDTYFSDTGYLNNNNNGYETKQQGMSGTRLADTGYLDNNNNNGYETKQQGISGTRFADTSYLKNNEYETKQHGTTDTRFVDTAYLNNNNNGYEVKQQGMSDTRFLENGKYYYDLDNENVYRNEYESQKGNQQQFGSYRGVEASNKYNKYYYGGHNGNNENAYEFSNSREGYQNQDEYQESQEEFVP